MMNAVMAVTGPKDLIEQTTLGLKIAIAMKFKHAKFEKVWEFPCPSDHGSFPDTTGYERDDFEFLQCHYEDHQLWPYMKNCMDAVLQFVNDREAFLDKLGYQSILTTIHWPREGGKVFAVMGVVETLPV